MNTDTQPKRCRSGLALFSVGLALGITATLIGVKIRKEYVWYMKGHALNYVRYACAEYLNNSSDIVSKRTWPETLDEFPEKLVKYPYTPRVPKAAFKDMVYVSNGKEYVAFFPYPSDSQRVVIGHAYQIVDDVRLSTAAAFARAEKIRNANQ